MNNSDLETIQIVVNRFLIEYEYDCLQTELASQMAIICIHQLRKESNSTRFLHLLGRFPPQIVQKAARQLKNKLLANLSLSSWVQNETTITSRGSQQFFDFILKGRRLAKV